MSETSWLNQKALEAAIVRVFEAREGSITVSGKGLTDAETVAVVLTAYFGALEPVGECVGSTRIDGKDYLVIRPAPGTYVPQPIGRKLYPGPIQEAGP